MGIGEGGRELEEFKRFRGGEKDQEVEGEWGKSGGRDEFEGEER